jgi:hypothetical protein
VSHYDALGVPKDADGATIKRAYRRKSREHHPDRPGGNTTAMVAINKAYETLSDPEKRARYDQFGDDRRGPPPLDQMARTIVMQIFMQLLEKTSDYDDLIKLTREQIRDSQKQIPNIVEQTKQKVAKLKKTRTRVKFRGEAGGGISSTTSLASRSCSSRSRSRRPTSGSRWAIARSSCCRSSSTRSSELRRPTTNGSHPSSSRGHGESSCIARRLNPAVIDSSSAWRIRILAATDRTWRAFKDGCRTGAFECAAYIAGMRLLARSRMGLRKRLRWDGAMTATAGLDLSFCLARTDDMHPLNMMTKAEFTRQYCERSGISEAQLLGRRVILRCYCGDPTCQGWACVPLDIVEWHMKTDGHKADQP